MKVILTNNDSTEIEERYLDFLKKGKIIQDINGCFIPPHAVVSVCEESETSVVGTAIVGTSTVGGGI